MGVVSQQLPAFENEDYGLLLFGLASLGQPLPPPLLARCCAEAARKLHGLSGEGLGLLVWGVAAYAYEVPDADEWCVWQCGAGHGVHRADALCAVHCWAEARVRVRLRDSC